MRDETVLTNAYLGQEGLSFDPEEVILEGVYRDELSAYRARRVWREALESNFLLELDRDFKLNVAFEDEKDVFKLRCDFGSACGRYAFWRLTHNQAPETQYLLETGHIPVSEQKHKELCDAADLSVERYLPAILRGSYKHDSTWSLQRLSHWVRSIFS
jgi:hypothetical protein